MTHKQSQIEIVIDERETILYDKCSEILLNKPETTSETPTIRISKCVLHLGDIAFRLHTPETCSKEILLFERKSLTDLLASIKDGRYKEQSHRLINASPLLSHNIIYLIEGIFTTLKHSSDKSKIISCMTSLNFFKGFSILKTASLNESAEYLISIAIKIVRDLRNGKPLPIINKPCRTINENVVVVVAKEEEENKDSEMPITMAGDSNTEISSADYCSVVKSVKKENVSKENISEIVLCQIPGISSITAMAIMKHFTNFSDFYQKFRENPNILESIMIQQSNGKKRKISKTSIQKIKEYLF